MPAPKNAMEIFQLLDKSNCRECGEKTCLAFAGAVFRGQKTVAECPRVDHQTAARYAADAGAANPLDENREAFMAAMRRRIAALDLAAAAERTGGRYEKGRLTIKVLGKDFSVDDQGTLSSDIHVNPWVAAPFLDYVIHAEGALPSGQWVSFRELKNGKDRYPLFQKRCEEAMQQVADDYTDVDERVSTDDALRADPGAGADLGAVPDRGPGADRDIRLDVRRCVHPRSRVSQRAGAPSFRARKARATSR